MRICLVLILTFLLFEPPPIGCSYFARKVPEEAYPQRVGRFEREYVLHGGQREISTKYVDPKRPSEHSIGLELSLGDFLDSSLAKCSAENIQKEANEIRLLKTAEVKDQSGTKAGEIRLCRDREQGADNFYLEMTNGEVSFFVRTNNLYGERGRIEFLNVDDIVKFASNIPYNAGLVFEGL